MLSVEIGDAIRVRRERAGLTQEALGALLAVHPDVIDDWEWGESAPAPSQARHLASLLGFPERSLLPAGLPGSGEEAIVVFLVPPAGGEAGPVTPACRSSLPGLSPVPTRPPQPPPFRLPGPSGERPGPFSASERLRRLPFAPAPAPVVPRPPPWLRLAMGGAILAVLVSVAATSGLAAYRQGQMAARHEAEARALRTTLVTLAGERDRLAARIVELTAALAEAGVAIETAAVSTLP